jgi:hypothetical protein
LQANRNTMTQLGTDFKIINAKVPTGEAKEFKKNLIDDNDNASDFLRRVIRNYNNEKKLKKHGRKVR